MLSPLSSEWPRNPRKSDVPTSGRPCDRAGVKLQHRPRRHRGEAGLEPVGLPRQVGVPDDRDTLDNSQPVMKGDQVEVG